VYGILLRPASAHQSPPMRSAMPPACIGPACSLALPVHHPAPCEPSPARAILRTHPICIRRLHPTSLYIWWRCMAYNAPVYSAPLRPMARAMPSYRPCALCLPLAILASPVCHRRLSPLPDPGPRILANENISTQTIPSPRPCPLPARYHIIHTPLASAALPHALPALRAFPAHHSRAHLFPRLRTFHLTPTRPHAINTHRRWHTASATY
jgi:hypothetical protein